MNGEAPLDRAVARQAARWFLRGREQALDADARAELARWRARAPEHERAWQRALRLAETFQSIPAELGMRTLDRRRRLDRRAALKHLALLIGTAPAAYLAGRALPLARWGASYRTAVGERRTLVLEDGTRVDLNTDSALDVSFDGGQRLLNLHGGEILVTSGGPDPADRPLRVRTGEGLMQALGTRFLVRRTRPGQSELAVFEGAVAVRPGAGGAPSPGRVLRAGQATRFDRLGLEPDRPAAESRAAWTRGRLVADDLPLDHFLAELGRYRAGFVQCDDRAARLRITGTFQLDHGDRILAALPDTLPVEVSFLTPYWVRVRGR
ncbi:FecR domain-containing protein [Alloalcanivorax marinus]|uniref:FecR domain-containing protein n=1 Tax=Alloalcanivorax marinus TaxID=1177169 RepID=UPI00195CC5F7|nr:FecR domain-containing protein [Alloalcanivorax marinus]MBM7333009.1 FecR domain-containing protein [Alloalcanivorax marinus]